MEQHLRYICLIVIILLCDYAKSDIALYPATNPNFPTTSLFKSRSFSFNVQATSPCTQVSVSASNIGALTYYYDSARNVVIIYDVTPIETYMAANPTGVVTLTVTCTSSTPNFVISSTKVYLETTASITIAPVNWPGGVVFPTSSSGTYYYTPNVSFTSSTKYPTTQNEIRYNYFFYVLNEIITAAHPKPTSSIICRSPYTNSSTDKNHFLFETIPTVITCSEIYTNSGRKVYFGMIAYHSYYNIYDTKSYVIYSRKNHIAIDTYSKNTLTIPAKFSPYGTVVFGFEATLKIVKSEDNTEYQDQSASYADYSPYVNAVYWKITCTYSVSPPDPTNCSIDPKGVIKIKDESNLQSAEIKYAINICNWEYQSLNEVSQGLTCSDSSFDVYYSNNLMSIGSFSITWNRTGMNVVISDWFKHFPVDNGLYYEPIYYTSYVTKGGIVLHWFEYDMENNKYNDFTDCQLTVLKSTLHDMKIESPSYYFSTVGTASYYVKCQFSDYFNTSPILSFKAYYYGDTYQPLRITVNPRIYQIGYILAKNVNNFTFMCNYVNKYYVLQYNINIMTEADYSATFGTVTSMNMATNPDPNYVWFTVVNPQSITKGGWKPTPSAGTNLIELFDIVYIGSFSNSGSTCATIKYQFEGKNIKGKSFIPPLLDIPGPRLFHENLTPDATGANQGKKIYLLRLFNFICIYTPAYCSLAVFRGATSWQANLSLLVDYSNTETTKRGIRWYMYPTNPKIALNQFTGVVTITDSDLLNEVKFDLFFGAFMTDEGRSVENRMALTYYRFTIYTTYMPKFYFNYTTPPAALNNPLVLDFDSLRAIDPRNNCCYVTSCTDARRNWYPTSPTTKTRNYFVCQVYLLPKIINTDPVQASVDNIFKIRVDRIENNSYYPYVYFWDANALLYYIIEDYRPASERFSITVSDDTVGKIGYTTGEQSIITSGATSGSYYFGITKTLETYIYIKNLIRINVPDRQEVLSFYPSISYTKMIEIDIPAGAGSITCTPSYTNTANYNLSFVQFEPTSSQYTLTLTKKSTTTGQLLDPIIISIYCADSLTTSVYFGSNTFTLYPNLEIGLFNSFYLFLSAATFNYITTTWASENTPTPNNGTNQILYKPYFINGLAFPYNYNVYNYTTKTFTKYSVINWNVASLKVNSSSSNANLHFCCLYSTDPAVKCHLENTNVLAAAPSAEPLKICELPSPSSNYYVSTTPSYSGLYYRSWFDRIVCNTITDPTLTENNVKCRDDVLSIKCMSSLPDGTIAYANEYVFTQSIQFCLHNIPRLQFLKSSVKVEVMKSTILADAVVDITAYIDFRNLLDGYIWNWAAVNNSGVNIKALGYCSYNVVTNILTIYSSNYSTMFPAGTSTYNIILTLYDAYERVSTNTFTIILLKNTNLCRTFNVPNTSPYTGLSPTTWVPGYLNKWVLYDSTASSGNIVSSYISDLLITKSPHLWNPPYLEFTPSSKITLVWESPESNVYGDPLIIQLTIPCPVDSTLTPSSLSLSFSFTADLPLPGWAPTMKPYVKCIVGSINSLSHYLGPSKADVFSQLNSSVLPSYSNLKDATAYTFLNTLIYTANIFPNSNTNPVTMENTGVKKYQVKWPTCDNVSAGFSTIFTNIPNITDTSISEPNSQLRGFMIHKNKFYFEYSTIYGHKQLGYYRFFPYYTISFDATKIFDTFVTDSTLLVMPIPILTAAENPLKIIDLYVATASCGGSIGGLLLSGLIKSNTSISPFYPVIVDVDNELYPPRVSLATTSVCAIIKESERKMYIVAENIITSPMTITLKMLYYPHFGMESSKFDVKIFKWTRSDINFNAIVRDKSSGSNQIITKSQSVPTKLLLGYGQNLKNLIEIVYTYNLSDPSVSIKPIMTCNIMGDMLQLSQDVTSFQWFNAIDSIITTTISTYSIDYSQAQLLPTADNHKFTIHCNFSIKSHVLRYDKPYHTNFKMMTNDLDNLVEEASFSETAYKFFNSFYINFAMVQQRLYMTINQIDPISLVSTQKCVIDDSTYYNKYTSANYFNSFLSPMTLSQCQISTTNEDILILQLFLSNASDRQDYVYLISSSAVPNCRGITINENLMVGDNLVMRLKDWKVEMPVSNVIDFTIKITVYHKYFENDLLTFPGQTYLKMQGLQQWINIVIPVQITKFMKVSRVQKFWSSSSLIYDLPSAQPLFATEGNQFVYNFNILSDFNLQASDITINAYDKYNYGATQNVMSFVLSACVDITGTNPSCYTEQQEDYGYAFTCPGVLRWVPTSYQFDSGLVTLHINSSIPDKSTVYAFNIGEVTQVNHPPTINGIDCKQIAYGKLKITNNQLEICSTDSSNRFVLTEDITYLIQIQWSDPDSYPTDSNVDINYTETTYTVNPCSSIAFHPPYLKFTYVFTPSSISTGLTQLSYDVWKIKITSTELNAIISNGNYFSMQVIIEDSKCEVLDSGSLSTVKTTISSTFDFSISNILNYIYIVDTMNYAQYDPDYYLIPRIFDELAASPDYQYTKFKMDFTLDNNDFVEQPTMPFAYTLTSSCDHSNNHLWFQTSSGVDSPSLTITTRPIQFTMTWNVLANNDDYSTYSCKWNVANSVGNSGTFMINACQLFYCRNRNIIYSYTVPSVIDYNTRITLKGYNFPAGTAFTNVSPGISGPAKIMVGNTECLDPQVISDREVNCLLPNIRGKKLIIWLKNDKQAGHNGYPFYSIQYPRLWEDEGAVTKPKVESYNLFTDKPSIYYVYYPYPANVYGSNYRGSCACLMTCNASIYYVKTLVKSSAWIICDYKLSRDDVILDKAIYFNVACSIRIYCLDHPTYHENGDIRDLTNSNSEIGISDNSIDIFVDEIFPEKMVFTGIGEHTSETAEYSPMPGPGSPKPHIMGGYNVSITFNKKPQCYVDAQACGMDYFYYRIHNLIIKAHCTDIDKLMCEFLMPKLPMNVNTFVISFTWDKGITFSDKTHSVILDTSGICQVGNYCPSYQQIQVPTGHFCELIPTNENEKYCTYPRPCPPGSYQDQPGQRWCKFIGKGYYLNYSGSNLINVPPKKCPLGYVCRETGLPKYYELCRPGHKCLNEGLSEIDYQAQVEKTEVPVAKRSIIDSYCGKKNFCKISTLFARPPAVTPPVSEFSVKDIMAECNLADFINFKSNVFNIKLFQRVFFLKENISLMSSSNFVYFLCALPCNIPTICSYYEHYFDLSTIRSVKGKYKPKFDCESCPNPDNSLCETDPRFSSLTQNELFQKTRQTSAIIPLLAKSDDGYKKSCFYYPDCAESTYLSEFNKCCYEGSCWCPPGFGCDIDNLNYPKICLPGYWRLDEGYTDIQHIRDAINPNILDFIDPVTSLYTEYKTYFENKYGSYFLNDITYYSRSSTTCIPCPPGYYCERGASLPKICAEGTFCEHQYSSQIRCSQGFYNNKPGQFKCLACPIGFYCPSEELVNAIPCPPGYYCPTIQIGTLDSGYTGTDYRIAPICPKTKYCPVGSSLAGFDCTKGKKCPVGSAFPLDCPPGTFNNQTARDSCFPCPRGYYCQTNSMIEPKSCDPGRVCPGMGLTSPSMICPTGHYCTGGVGYLANQTDYPDFNSRYPGSLPIPCEMGKYCIQGASKSSTIAGDITSPQDCNPGEYNDLSGQGSCKICDDGYECPESGMINQRPCKKGTYRNQKSNSITCIDCPEGTFGSEAAYASPEQCHPCPRGAVCVISGIALEDFRTVNEGIWKFCSEGYICGEGTNLEKMHDMACPQGKFCQAGVQSANDAIDCPSGRVCPEATAASSSKQVTYCAFADPTYCYVGQICQKGYFCPAGTARFNDTNSCFNQISFKGARERFFCKRDITVWNKIRLVDITYEEDSDYLFPVNMRSDETQAALRVLAESSGNVTNTTDKNTTANTDTNSTNKNSTNTTSEAETLSLYSMLNENNSRICLNDTLVSFETRYITFNFSKQNGFPPDNYDFIFTITTKKNKKYMFTMFENNNNGGFGEIPLYPEAKIFLAKNNFIWKIKLVPQEDVYIMIQAVYFEGPFFNYYYDNPIFDCKKLVTLVPVDTAIANKLDSKNLLTFFSMSKKWFSEKLSLPANLMYINELKTDSNINLFPVAISMFEPTILDFVNFQKYFSNDEKQLDSKYDYFIYKSCQIGTTPSENVLTSQANYSSIFSIADTSGVQKDNIVTAYLPFISNCRGLGSHITIRNLLEYKENCTLYQKDEQLTFGFLDFFANAQADQCTYYTYCFYDERYDSGKQNWMQYDFANDATPLMNISQYSLNPTMFNMYVKDYFLQMPSEEEYPDDHELLSSMIPLKIYTEIGRYSGETNVLYTPTEVTLRILYYNQLDNQGDTQRIIIRAELILDKFEQIVNKENIEENYKSDFGANKVSDKIKYQVYNFFRDQTLYRFMDDIEFFVFFNYFGNTTQFNQSFPTYSDYQTFQSKLTGTSTSNGLSAEEILTRGLNSVAELESYVKALAQREFSTQTQDSVYDSPPQNLLSPERLTDLGTKYKEQYEDIYKDYMNNAYILKKHIYKFNVEIRPATWLEALNYNAFSLSSYMTIALMFLIFINSSYFLYWLVHQVGFLRSCFKIHISKFTEERIKDKKWYANYETFGKSTCKVLFHFLKNNTIAFFLTGIPTFLLVITYLGFFSFSGIFNELPISVKESGDASSTGTAEKANKLGRVGLAIVSLGFFLLCIGMQLLKPDYPPEIAQKRGLISEQDKIKKVVERWEYSSIIFMLILNLIVLIFQISNFYKVSSVVEIVILIIFQFFVSGFIMNLFFMHDYVIIFIITTIVNCTLYILLLEILELNIMLLLFLINHILKFWKIAFQRKYDSLYRVIFEKLKLRKTMEKLEAEERIRDRKKRTADDDEDKTTANDEEKVALTTNSKILMTIASEICTGFIVIPVIYCKIFIIENILVDDVATIFTIQTFFILVTISFGLDLINFTFLFLARKKKDPHFDMISIFVEMNYIYGQRNSPWAIDSTAELNNTFYYRKYDSKFEMMQRLGFSPQLFIITLLFGYSFNLVYLGINTMLKVNVFPWLDMYLLFIGLGLFALYVAILLGIKIISKKVPLWSTPEVQIKMNEKLKRMKDQDKAENVKQEENQSDEMSKLEVLRAQMRKELSEIWLDDRLTKEEKRQLTTELFRKFNPGEKMHQYTKEYINSKYQEKYLEVQDATKTLNMENHLQKYDNVPLLPMQYTNLKLNNFHKDVALALSDSVGENFSRFLDIQNRAAVRKDILDCLNYSIPKGFGEPTGVMPFAKNENIYNAGDKPTENPENKNEKAIVPGHDTNRQESEGEMMPLVNPLRKIKGELKSEGSFHRKEAKGIKVSEEDDDE